MSLTTEDLHELRNIFATKEDLNALRTDAAQNSADLRRFMEILIEDLQSNIHVVFDGLAARIESLHQGHTSTLERHESRIGSLELRTTALESRRPKRR